MGINSHGKRLVREDYLKYLRDLREKYNTPKELSDIIESLESSTLYHHVVKITGAYQLEPVKTCSIYINLVCKVESFEDIDQLVEYIDSLYEYPMASSDRFVPAEGFVLFQEGGSGSLESFASGVNQYFEFNFIKDDHTIGYGYILNNAEYLDFEDTVE